MYIFFFNTDFFKFYIFAFITTKMTTHIKYNRKKVTQTSFILLHNSSWTFNKYFTVYHKWIMPVKISLSTYNWHSICPFLFHHRNALSIYSIKVTWLVTWLLYLVTIILYNSQVPWSQSSYVLSHFSVKTLQNLVSFNLFDYFTQPIYRENLGFP